MARTQTGRDFGTNSRRKSTQQMYMCRLLPSSRILRRCATNADCRLADLQTSRLADSKICRPTFFVTGLWANFIHPLFTVGESQSMSEANNSASGLQTQQCPIRQVTGNPCRGRLNIGRTVT